MGRKIIKNRGRERERERKRGKKRERRGGRYFSSDRSWTWNLFRCFLYKTVGGGGGGGHTGAVANSDAEIVLSVSVFSI